MTRRAGTLVIGIGNDFRRDDGAGLALVRRLRELQLPGVDCVESDGDAALLPLAWRDHDDVILVDAMRSGDPPGTVVCFDPREDPAGHRLRVLALPHSTHALGIAYALRLAESMGMLPGRMTLYGIEARDVDYGRGLSPEVAQAVESLAQRLVADRHEAAAIGT